MDTTTEIQITTALTDNSNIYDGFITAPDYENLPPNQQQIINKSSTTSSSSPSNTANGTNTSHNSGSGHASNVTCHGGANCLPGLLLPFWHSKPPEAPTEDRVFSAIAFVIVMIYIFIGMSIVSNVFVCAIEKITSQKRRIKIVSKTTGKTEFIHVPVWNETIAHLTMHVFGSCAPEIILSVIEVIAHPFSPGELGPGAIVGAGAYNLFIIQGICIASVTRGRSKRVENLRLYFVTAAWGIFAYIWLYIILVPSSSGVVEIWESVLTLLFYPVFVASAYLVDKKFFNVFSPKKRATVAPMIKIDEVRSGTSSPVPASTTSSEANAIRNAEKAQVTSNEAVSKAEQRYLEIIEEMQSNAPGKTNEELHQLAAVRLLKEMPKGYGYYRLQTTAGGDEVINVKKLQDILDQAEEQRLRDEDENTTTQIITFDPDVYTVMEDIGVFYVNVVRRGAGIQHITTVQYRTKDGTGKAGVDYTAASGTVVFNKGERLKQIPLHMIDDDEFTSDNEFYLQLFDPKIIYIGASSQNLEISFGKTSVATIKKLDDDHGGIFHLESDEFKIEENIGEAQLKIVRSSGVKGRVVCPFKIIPITALPTMHYEELSNVTSVTFEARQTEQIVRLRITNEGKLKKEKTFKIELGEPTWAQHQHTLTARSRKRKARSKAGSRLASAASKYELDDDDDEINAIMGEDLSRLGRPRLGTPAAMVVRICENPQLRAKLDEIINLGKNVGDLVTTKSYREQFLNAITIHGDTDNETGKSLSPTWKNYVTHFVTIFWKLLFATIPPVSIAHGWLAAFCALIYIGVMTAVIGDLASQLGCTIGLRDELTAITLVALGTSLPDMFASRLAALREESADAAIGHVNGTIAVNVFLGLGLSWTVAAINQYSHGLTMRVPPGSLAFSFTIFLSFAVCCTVVVLLRRLPPVHGELGGPVVIRTLTVTFFMFLWLTYVVLSALDNYCLINTF